ncbi:MAG TPA: DAK2 domain-containing protein [Dehalococcoidia bacterium]|nr:DAK2 domain-containing protein [Dehalococcoidia bacterium]
MDKHITLSGKDLREMLVAGTGWLERIVPDINALNVYPVPDGDCGINMLFTMRSSLAETTNLDEDAGIASVAAALAKGSLMGARGNSGVILSQIWRGLSEGVAGKEIIDAKEFAAALEQASETARHALSNPVEGTILTVIKDAASAAAQEALNSTSSPISAIEAAVDAARISVKKTPDLLQVLKDAGVVDAGGHGFFTLFEGALLHLKNDMDNRSPELLNSTVVLSVQTPQIVLEEEPYGFCTQFMINGTDLDLSGLRDSLTGMGKSLIVVGDSNNIRVHIHTQEPNKVLETALEYGEPIDIDINDMDEQHIEFLVLHKEKMSKNGTAIIAVVNGDGMMRAFSELGVSAIIPGGQTMNPSTMDMLQTIEEVIPDNIIFLPNNKNVIPTANLLQPLTKKNIRIIPTETIPQGISALIAYIPEVNFDTNIEEMTDAITTVRTIEITHATRTTKVNGLNISGGEIIGLLDGIILTSGKNYQDTITELLAKIDMDGKNILTIYYGKDADPDQTQDIRKMIGDRYTGLEIGVVDGGQPHYEYIISVD